MTTTTSELKRLLALIEEGIAHHGGELGGSTRHADDTLQLFEGRASLQVTAEINEGPGATTVHGHIITTLREYDDEALDACLFGMASDFEEAATQVAIQWIAGVAGSIKSLLENTPVCMSCQVGVPGGDPEHGFLEADLGLSGVRAYVGPAFFRGIADGDVQNALLSVAPTFRYAVESAAPRRAHLVKATVMTKDGQRWTRDLEIDGHDVAHHESDWPADAEIGGFGYFTRFAVFELAEDSAEFRQRTELERTIHAFATSYSPGLDMNRHLQTLAAQGFDSDVLYDIENFGTMAFGRVLFEPVGIEYPSFVTRARRDGRVETGVPLMSVPAYNRGRAIAGALRATMPEQAFQALGLISAESHAIVKAMESMGHKFEPSEIRLLPCVVPDRGVSNATMRAALRTLDAPAASRGEQSAKKTSWWRFGRRQ